VVFVPLAILPQNLGNWTDTHAMLHPAPRLDPRRVAWVVLVSSFPPAFYVPTCPSVDRVRYINCHGTTVRIISFSSLGPRLRDNLELQNPKYPTRGGLSQKFLLDCTRVHKSLASVLTFLHLANPITSTYYATKRILGSIVHSKYYVTLTYNYIIQMTCVAIS
jgi:hypothetical protein